MKKFRGWMVAGLLGLMSASIGCQTWVAGMTLPSPRYLEHPPQYFPPSPAYPFERELAAMEAAAAERPIEGAPQALPPQIPLGGR